MANVWETVAPSLLQSFSLPIHILEYKNSKGFSKQGSDRNSDCVSGIVFNEIIDTLQDAACDSLLFEFLHSARPPREKHMAENAHQSRLIIHKWIRSEHWASNQMLGWVYMKNLKPILAQRFGLYFSSRSYEICNISLGLKPFYWPRKSLLLNKSHKRRTKSDKILEHKFIGKVKNPSRAFVFFEVIKHGKLFI